ncbi:MAG: hypothetical protein JOZ80_13835, partial [Acidobacteriaceae bacterium]|nr:hypothetical protein [Acidobacteriaceae bacterium]
MSALIFGGLLVAAAILAADDSAHPATTAPLGPPKAKVDNVVDTIHGHEITDPYRWLENANSRDAQQYVREEMAYTRSILDPLPGRAQIHARLKQLMSIGTITAPQIAGPYYFYTRRDGIQNQPVLMVREGLHGKDRALVDVNKMSAEGTTALDWWYPSDDGKYVAYGISINGSEESVLHVIESATGKALPDQIARTRFASVAWKKDNSGFYYTRHPNEGEVPAGEEVYHVKVFYHALGTRPANDPLVFGERRNPQDIPQVALPDDDDRWLLINVQEGWTKSEMYLQDLKAGTSPVELTNGNDFLYSGEIFRGKLYITTNEDAPRFHVFVVDAEHPQREYWREIIPETDAVLKGAAVFGGKLFAQYEKDASSQLRIFELDGRPVRQISLPAIGTVGGVTANDAGIGGRWDRNEAFFDFSSFTVPPAVYRVDVSNGKSELWDKVEAPGIDPAGYE